MEQLLEKIHRCNAHERQIFGARLVAFSETMDRWHSDVRPEQQNNNFFAARGPLCRADLRAAVELQKSRGLRYLMLETREPLAPALVEEFGLELERTWVMALTRDTSDRWKENPALEIRDIQFCDISRDILDVSDVPEEFRAQARTNMEMVLKVAKEHPGYHWLCGYVNGQKVATVYALCHDGCIEMDDLWVEEGYRNRYIATTLMKHIAKNLDGILYLHADADRTPKDMYLKMGFEKLEETYSYFAEWDN